MLSKSKYWIIGFAFCALIIIPVFLVLSKDDNNTSTNTSENIQKKILTDVQQDSSYSSEIQNIIKLFNPSTSLWTDIDYADNSRTNWDLTNHIKRIKKLAVDYSANKNHTQNITIINDALSVWFQKKYTCPNWFTNDITVNQLLVDIFRNVGTVLNKDNYQNIAQRIEAIQPEKKNGVNRVWLAAIQLKYGLYKNDIILIQKSKKFIANEIVISKDNESLQPDYSYHFHKERIQMYAYGKGFLETCIDVLSLVSNTDFAFEEDKISVIRNFIFEGWLWLARGKYTVPSSQDRSSSRKGGLTAPEVIATLNKMKKTDPKYTAQYQSLIEQQKDISKFSLNGTKAFPYSDIAVAHSPKATFFIKVLSDRNLPTESINSENLKGKFLHFGNHFIIQDGQEYTNLAGAWDWNLLPGFSYIKEADTILRNSATGVADFNQTIVANMVLDYIGKNKKSITKLYKTWIVQKDRLICLISAPDKNFNGKIVTSLDQTKFRDDAYIRFQKIKNEEQKNFLQKNQWLYHHHLVYYSPNPEAIQYQIKKSENDWKSINDRYRKDKNKPETVTLFTPTINQTNNNISYSIFYADSIADVSSKLAVNNYSVIQNNANAQVAYLNNEGAYCGTIHQANYTVKIKRNIKIESDTPILFLLQNKRIFVSEPTLKTAFVNLEINNKTYKIKLDNVGQGNVSL